MEPNSRQSRNTIRNREKEQNRSEESNKSKQRGWAIGEKARRNVEKFKPGKTYFGYRRAMKEI